MVPRSISAALAASLLLYALTGCADWEDLVVDGEDVELNGEQRFEVVTVITGGRILVIRDEPEPSSGWLHLQADSVFIDESSEIEASGAGYPGGFEGKGLGPGGGRGYSGSRSGSGGGYGGRGADGASGCMSGDNSGGKPYGTKDRKDIEPGSGGGGNRIASGGHGGGAIILDTELLELEGKLLANGRGGRSGTGGGSGGGILILATSGFISGTLTAKGGPGCGEVAYEGMQGGGGGGGRIKVFRRWRLGADPLDLDELDYSVAGRDGPCGDQDAGNGSYYEG
jgi:hypothetical protein